MVISDPSRSSCEATINHIILSSFQIMYSNPTLTFSHQLKPTGFPYMLSQRNLSMGRSFQVQSPQQHRPLRVSLCPMVTPSRQRLNRSDFYNVQHKRPLSPIIHQMEDQTDGFVSGLERSVLQENRNIKQHNNFLKQQIKLMFQREKKYKGSLLASRQKIRELEDINSHLQAQLQTLFSKIITEIERIQRVIEEQGISFCDDILMFSRSVAQTPRKNTQFCSETESTINNNLEDLKARVANMARQGNLEKVYSQEQFKLLSPISTNNKEMFFQAQSIITKENSIKDACSFQNEKDDLFDTYLPATLLKEEKKQRQNRGGYRQN